MPARDTKKITETQWAKYMQKVAELYKQGHSVRVIASKIRGIEKSTVQKMLKQLEKEWMKEAEEDFAKFRAFLLAKLRMVQVNAWKMFAKSCRNYKEDSETRNYSMQKVEGLPGEDKGKELLLNSTSEHVQASVVHGNPKYLSIILDCIEKEAKLLGVYDWVNREVNGEGNLSGAAEIHLNQKVYIDGIGTIKPEMLTPEIWEALHSLLPNQDPHHYDVNTE